MFVTTFILHHVACAKEDLCAPPTGYMNRWSGTEVGSAHLGVPYFPIIVGLAILLLSNSKETLFEKPARS